MEIKVAVFLVIEGNDCFCRPRLMLEVDVVLEIGIRKFKEATQAGVANIAAEVEVREWFDMDGMKVLLLEL